MLVVVWLVSDCSLTVCCDLSESQSLTIIHASYYTLACSTTRDQLASSDTRLVVDLPCGMVCRSSRRGARCFLWWYSSFGVLELVPFILREYPSRWWMIEMIRFATLQLDQRSALNGVCLLAPELGINSIPSGIISTWLQWKFAGEPLPTALNLSKAWVIITGCIRSF